MDTTVTATSQALEALRRADDDNRARAAEMDLLRRTVVDLKRSLQASSDARERAESIQRNTMAELDRQTQALNIVLKELSATRESLRQYKDTCERQRKTLEQLTSQSQAMGSMLAAKATTTCIEGGVAHSGPVQYLQYCYATGADPALDVLRTLHHRSPTIEAMSASFQQLAVLAEVVRSDPLIVASFATALDVSCTADHVAAVCELIRCLPGLKRITAHGVEDMAAAPLFDTLRLAEHILELELPELQLSDPGLAHLWHLLRQQRGDRSGGSPEEQRVTIRTLDCSRCAVRDAAAAFADFAGGHALRALDLSNVVAMDNTTLRAILAQCPALSQLSLARCSKVTSDVVCEALNGCTSLREVDLTGCTAMTTIRLDNVQILRTTLASVAVLVAPKLASIPTPLASFQVVEWQAPCLEQIAMNGVTLGSREGNMLSASMQIKALFLIQCRAHNLDVLFKRMRHLESLSLSGTRGITDSDIRALCTSSLREVDLTDNFLLTDVAMRHLAGCPRLSRLSLKRCANVTDVGLAFFEGHESLEHLNLLGTKKISLSAIHKLIESNAASLRCVVHEALLSTAVQVERDDDEEALRRSIDNQEHSLAEQRMRLSANASPLRPASSVSQRSASPRSEL